MDRAEQLIGIVSRETNAPEISLDTRLDSLGIDSLEFVALMRVIEGEFATEIPDAHYAQLHTVRDILAVL